MRLALAQLACFSLLEIIERSLVSGEIVMPLGDRAFQLGFALQLVTAVLGALLFCGLTRVVAVVARIYKARDPQESGIRPQWPSRLVVYVRSLLGAGARTLRGPPAPSRT
jgi:hypothetical protein